MGKIYKGDVGTEIIVDTGESLSEAIEVKLYVRVPITNGRFREVEWVGEVFCVTKIRYVTQAGDINRAGTYSLQVYVKLPTWSGRGETTSFKVYDKWE